MELKRENEHKNIDIEEFKALVNNLVPTTLKQAKWICKEVDRLTQEHPELKTKIKEWSKIPESEKRELEDIIHQILDDAEKARQKW
ncbi:MAG: hypothetical protein WC325_01755 [Candidatus Bathyarchaeia archaeon]